MNNCYIQSIAQISCQTPLSDDWFENPAVYDCAFAPTPEYPWKEFISPALARRMSPLMRRCMTTSLKVLEESAVQNMQPDSIITSTELGCMDNSEKFLTDITLNNEQSPKPTPFMQSTHNTLGSTVAIHLGCHGYNNTYTHGNTSFESALLDAYLQIRTGTAHNILLGAHDEVTQIMAKPQPGTIPKAGLRHADISVAMIINNTPTEETLAQVKEVYLYHRPDNRELSKIITPEDRIILCVHRPLDLNSFKSDTQPTLLHVDQIFGSGHSASAAAFYAAIIILRKGFIPSYMYLDGSPEYKGYIDRLTIFNDDGKGNVGIVKICRP